MYKYFFLFLVSLGFVVSAYGTGGYKPSAPPAQEDISTGAHFASGGSSKAVTSTDKGQMQPVYDSDSFIRGNSKKYANILIHAFINIIDGTNKVNLSNDKCTDYTEKGKEYVLNKVTEAVFRSATLGTVNMSILQNKLKFTDEQLSQFDPNYAALISEVCNEIKKMLPNLDKN